MKVKSEDFRSYILHTTDSKFQHLGSHNLSQFQITENFISDQNLVLLVVCSYVYTPKPQCVQMGCMVYIPVFLLLMEMSVR